ncbi:hypothetical protein AAG906_017019 [Vitis piasezkii]
MEDNIADTYILFPMAKRIWDVVTLAYSNLENSSQMFELRNKARNLWQGEHDLTQYYSDLTKLWQELGLFNLPVWKDPDDVGIKPLPQIEEIFAEVRCEECRRHVMLGGSTISTIETSALAACGLDNRAESRGNKKWCDHCQKPNHTKNTCWKLHGKPANWTPS